MRFYPEYIATLMSEGFVFFSEEPSFLIEVLHGDLSLRMDRGNLKRLKKAYRMEMISTVAKDWLPLYQLLSENRAQKNASLAMSQAEIAFMMEQFPQNCFWFSTHLEGEGIAAAFVLQSLPGCWQVVYWGHLPGTEQFSPVTHLANAIYQEAQRQQITYIDLGTASLEGKPNEGLIRYKLNLGALPSRKVTFVKYGKAP
jgi:hypothetical protein